MPAAFTPVPCEACEGEDFERLATMWSPVLPRVRLPVAICRGCGFVTVNPRPPAGSFGRYNAEWFSRETAGVSPHGAGKWELFWQRVGDRCRDRHGLAVLDIGARHGEALAFVAERVPGARLTALELVESFHAHLRAIGAEVIAADLERPWPAALAGRFDLVIFRHTLEHLEQPLQALRNIAAALSPGGMVYIAVPNAMAGRPGQPMRTDYFRPVHAHYFNRSTLIRLAARAGLHPVRCEAEGELWGLFGTAPRRDDAAPGTTYEAQLAFARTRLAAARRADLRAILRILARRLLSPLRS